MFVLTEVVAGSPHRTQVLSLLRTQGVTLTSYLVKLSRSSNTTRRPLVSLAITRLAGLMAAMEEVEEAGRAPVRIITAEYKAVSR